ncbi:MAG: Ig-like domain-containing protein [Treponema sp.]|jgi:hypothetical protein|nr:Ig-like domain-containing protein [Treponema sp.]
MKNSKLTILLGFIALASLLFFSCNDILSLGSALDLDGPILTITSPAPRKAIRTTFELEGNVTDYSGVDRLLITTKLNNEELARQWRYNKGAWEISENSGASWSSYQGASWKGSSKSADWIIPIDMRINDVDPEDGEYTFIVQAWDTMGNTDDNSYRTIVLIMDKYPPSVEISSPFLHSRLSDFDSGPLYDIHIIPDNSDDWKKPENIGKFITQEFNMQYHIDNNHDIWSIDIFFFYHDEEIDQDPGTELPDTYIYRYYDNFGPPPDSPEPGIMPNGSVIVPALESLNGTYDKGGVLKNRITEKTTVKVVALCYNFAGIVNEEKVIGYFVYWPRANEPWITYIGELDEPDSYYGQNIIDINDTVYMIYPGRSIKATAFQAHGVSKVVFSLFSVTEHEGKLTDQLVPVQPSDTYQNAVRQNQQRPNGSYSTIFPWEFVPPPRSGYFVVNAVAYDAKDNESEEYSAIFRVQDITFPDFPDPPQPPASDPLYMAINNNTIQLSGTVSDATNVVSLCLVWINPNSRNYAAMSQLAYFRDKDYGGWNQALALSAGATDVERTQGGFTPYDPANPNRVWNLQLTNTGEDPDTHRQVYSYSQIINLASHLNIGPGSDQRPLTSQVFLLRAENPDGKCTIISYAPQGDTTAPKIFITEVDISGEKYTPGTYGLIPQFTQNDTIIIKGEWEEGSIEYLNFGNYLKDNIDVTINGQSQKARLQFDTADNANAGSGIWTAAVTVGPHIDPANLKDTLVISATIRDIGGNRAEAGASWLIQSDHLRLMRISSENLDDTYTVGAIIEIFLEFSKPVKLKNSGNPQITLNTGATATYKTGQINQSTRQYFVYTVGAGQNSDRLNVTGLQGVSGEQWQNANYPFSWDRGVGEEYEEIRITTDSTHNGDRPSGTFYARNLPVTTTSSNPDYQFTLYAGKEIVIDTTPPVVSSITANNPEGYYSTGTDLYITARFNKAVKIGTTTPRLTLQVNNGANTTVQTSADISTIRVNNNEQTSAYEMTFVYRVAAGDFTPNGGAVVVSNFTGNILDLAGNALPATGVSGVAAANRTLTGRVIDTTAPTPPTLRALHTGGAYNENNVVTNTVNGAAVTAESGAAVRNLSNLYNDRLWLAIQGSTASAGVTNTGAHKLSELEYSIDNGANWVKAPNTTNTPFEITQPVNYQIIVRQISQAGVVSANSNAVNFNWDPGNLVTRISSPNSNDTYTQNPGRNNISITVTFRKPVRFTGTPGITLNATRGGNPITVTTTPPANTVSSLSFTYEVQLNDSIPGGANLDVTGFSGITAYDAGTTGTTGVNVSTLIVLPPAGDARLGVNKAIKVETGTLNTNSHTFNNDTAWMGLPNNETNTRFQGIRADDGSYWTTLEIQFNRDIIKGIGNITITQTQGTTIANGYRVPLVLTQTQYNRFRNIANLDTYYTRGTNGYINGVGADTSTKYILNYNYHPWSGTATNAGFTGNIPIPVAFANAFRDAESVTIPVDAQDVEINGSMLKVRLIGSNAPQVPGASYTVTYPAGFVQDNLGNLCTAGNTNVNLSGTARPFIRVRKPQDTVGTQAGTAAAPRLTVTLPWQAYARMDTRTPGAAITYTRNEWSSNTAANNWSTTGTPNDATGGATRPANATGTAYTNNSQITLGNAGATDAEQQGYQWWARAIASSGTPTANSYEAEEIANRTVITYQLRNTTNAITAGAGEQILGNGDQIWIRGGDAIGSSSIPGFPLTWEDNWNTLGEKRAGIRLMRLVSVTGGTLNNSIWRWVTWEINTTAYIDTILGRDTESTAAIAQQYGPRYWAYQRAGWTSFKDRYPIYPGKHRWLDAGQDHVGKGAINFSGTLSARPANPGN